MSGWILEEYQREGRNREVEVGQVVRRGWLLRSVGRREGRNPLVERPRTSIVALVVDTTKRTSSRVHSSARERNWELEKERTQRGRQPRSARVRARGTLTFTR